jgi:chemotaxis protein MotB
MATLDRNADPSGRKKRASLFRVGPPPPEKDETEVRWLISYSDFMMQLVCVFILLYSVSAIDVSKAAPLAQAWREEAGIAEARVEPPASGPHVPLTLADLPPIFREFRIMAGRHPGGGALRVARNADGFRLHIAYEMFERGSDRLGKQGTAVAELAGLLLQPIQHRVRSIDVVGHASADEPDGQSLSLGRAREAVRWMTRPESPSRLDPARVLAAARGAHEPAADNAESSGRAVNRRVEFVVRLAAAR